jgi:hypothetical protein
VRSLILVLVGLLVGCDGTERPKFGPSTQPATVPAASTVPPTTAPASVERFGLSEAKRRMAYRDSMQARRMAWEEGERLHPNDPQKQGVTRDAATARLKQAVANKYGVTLAQLKEIEQEGHAGNWPGLQLE